ncbi:SPASM domain-containing protein, partial [bacterium]|nr:SPASM domain-containing protein [bacterium]
LGVFDFEYYSAALTELQSNAHALCHCHIGALSERLKERPRIALEDLTIRDMKQIADLNLVLSDSCNLACVYCHSDSRPESQVMSFQIARTAIDHLFESLSERANKTEARLQFSGGGEPALHLSLLRSIVDYFRQRCSTYGVRGSVGMPTNGAYGMSVAAKLADTLDYASLSIDGPQPLFDMHRPFPNGSSPFSLVMNTADVFRSKGLHYALRATVSNRTISMSQAFFSFFMDKFPGISVGLEALNPIGRGSDLQESVTPPSQDEFTAFLLEAYRLSSENGIDFRNSMIGKFELLRAHFCTSIGLPGLTVLPNGNIVACTRASAPDIYRFGHVGANGVVSIDRSRMQSLRRQNVTTFDECTDCFCKYNCAGGCLDLRLAGCLRCNTAKQLGNAVLRQKAGLPFLENRYALGIPKSQYVD